MRYHLLPMAMVCGFLLHSQPAQAGAVITFLGELSGYSDATLVQNSNGMLYGTTLPITGANGTVFEATTNPLVPATMAVEPTLVSFSPSIGGKPYAGVMIGPGGMLFGTTAYGARTNALLPNGMGSIYSMTAGNDLSLLYAFGSMTNSAGQPLDGASPRSKLVLGTDGSLYGTAWEGGSNGYAGGGLGWGTIYKFAANGLFTELHSFAGDDGAHPTSLCVGPDYNLYGVVSFGGSSTNVVETNGNAGDGTIYAITTNGAFRLLHSFGAQTNAAGGSLDGSQPNPLVLGPDGNFYGTTAFGGSNTTVINSNRDIGYGTFFRISTNGVFSSLYSFGTVTNTNGVPLDGGNPSGPLVIGADGNFYGITQIGGLTNTGSAFRITPQGQLTTLVSFPHLIVYIPPPIEGPHTSFINPVGGLLLAADGSFYGVTSPETKFGENGGIYRIGPPAPAVADPPGMPASLTIPAGASHTYALTVNAIYPFSSQWQFDGTNLVDGGSITGSATATLTISNATLANSGTYTLVASNLAGIGTASGTLTVVPAVFETQPASAVIPAGATNTLSVAVNSIFPFACQWQRNGTNLTDGGEFSGSATAQLVVTGAQAADSGSYVLVVSNSAGAVQSAPALLTVEPFVATALPANLTIMGGTPASFSIELETDLPTSYQWQFDGANLAAGGNISGSTTNSLVIASAEPGNSGTYSIVASNSAGSSNWTAVLTVIPETAGGAVVSNVHSFTDGLDGAFPNALLLGPNGVFYGTTLEGGSTSSQTYVGAGTLFSLETNGVLSNLYSFTGGPSGANPYGPLTGGASGVFYGTTENTVFKAVITDSNSAVTTLTNGGYPQALALGTNGMLYGLGGSVLYILDPVTDQLTESSPFTNLSISAPCPYLTVGDDGNFYGTTTASGGALFKMDYSGRLTVLYEFTNSLNGSSPWTQLLRLPDGALYGTTQTGGLYGMGTVFKFSTNEGLTTLYSFGAVSNAYSGAWDGSSPGAGLAMGPDGNLYGCTYDGGFGGAGFAGDGTLFEISTNGDFITLAWMTDTTGTKPFERLALGPDGAFYGQTEYGGTGWGAIFRLVPPPAPWQRPQMQVQSALDGAVAFQWNSIPGLRYQLQGSSDLSEGSWTVLQATLASDFQSSDIEPIANEARFYRVAVVSGN